MSRTSAPPSPPRRLQPCLRQRTDLVSPLTSEHLPSPLSSRGCRQAEPPWASWAATPSSSPDSLSSPAYMFFMVFRFDDARPAEPDEGCSSAVPAGSGYDVDDDTGYRSEAEFPSDSSDAEEEDGPDDVEDVSELAFGSDLASCRGEEDVYPREDGQYVVACDEFAQEMHAAASGSSPAKFVPSKNGFYIKRWGGAASE